MCVVWKDVFNCLTSGGRRKRNRESEKERGKRQCDVERKRGRSWKEGEWKRVSRERRLGLVATHSRFIINVIVFFLFCNFFKFLQYYHQLFYSIQFLRHLKEFFGVMFKIQAQQSDDDNSVAGGESKILISCVGAGYTNINKTMM